MAAAKKIDYERIEPGWRAGILSPQQLAEIYTAETGVPITRSAINKHFRDLGIPRDLAAKVHAKADELLASSMVSGGMVSGKVSPEPLKPIREAEIVAHSAATEASVRLEHRRDITRMRALVLRLLDECEAEAATPGLFASLGEIMASPDERGRDRAREAYDKAIGLPQRIKGVKELAEALRVLVGMEREAYGITSGAEAAVGDDGAADVINTLKRLRGQGVRTALQPGIAMGFEDIDVG